MIDPLEHNCTVVPRIKPLDSAEICRMERKSRECMQLERMLEVEEGSRTKLWGTVSNIIAAWLLYDLVNVWAAMARITHGNPLPDP
jgi:hypothetical protein